MLRFALSTNTDQPGALKSRAAIHFVWPGLLSCRPDNYQSLIILEILLSSLIIEVRALETESIACPGAVGRGGLISSEAPKAAGKTWRGTDKVRCQNSHVS